MSNELKTQFNSGATVYAVLLNVSGHAWRADTQVFETPLAADWGHYATAVTEQSTTGIYEGNFPIAITTPGAYNVLFRQQSGGSPAASDFSSGMIGGTIFWTGSAEAFPLASSATNATNLAMISTGVSSAPAPGSIDIGTLTANLSAVLVRNYLITTGTTTPATADQWNVGGIYNNVVYYASKTTALYVWNNGSGWTISSSVGANGSAYWTTAGGAGVAGPYTAAGTATGNPTVIAHGNAVLNAFQPDIPFPANFGSLAISNSGVANANMTEVASQTANASASVTFPSSIGTSTFAAGGSVNATQIGGQNVQLDGNNLLKVDAADWGGSAVGSMPGSGNVTVGGFVPGLVDGNGLLKVDVEDWKGTEVSLSGGLPSVKAGNIVGGGPIAINQNTGGTDNLRYVDNAATASKEPTC